MPPEDADFDPLREWARARDRRGRASRGPAALVRAAAPGRAGSCFAATPRRERVRRRCSSSRGCSRATSTTSRRWSPRPTSRSASCSSRRRSAASQTLLERLCEDAPLTRRRRGARRAPRRAAAGRPTRRSRSCCRGRPPHRHAALAARLRRGGSASGRHAQRIGGRARLGPPRAGGPRARDPTWRCSLGEPTRAARAASGARGGGGARRARQARSGARGVADASRTICWRSSPAARRDSCGDCARGSLEPMADGDRAELARTLRDAARMPTWTAQPRARALHVHRNTLAYRICADRGARDVDLGEVRDIAGAYWRCAGRSSRRATAALVGRRGASCASAQDPARASATVIARAARRRSV